jgi:hypothetical protein
MSVPVEDCRDKTWARPEFSWSLRNDPEDARDYNFVLWGGVLDGSTQHFLVAEVNWK